MSLVAYEYSSDEGSDGDESGEPNQDPVATTQKRTHPEESMEVDIENTPVKHLHLPAPKKTNDLNVEEDDDEFLHKKAIPDNIALEKPPAATNLTIKPKIRNGKVQITIPSMKEFNDIDDAKETKKIEKQMIGAALPKKSTSLLSLLPKPRTSMFDAPKPSSSGGSAESSISASKPISKRLVPDSVANRPRNVPMSIQKTKTTPGKPLKSTTSTATPANNSEDEDSDEEMDDFFSFNKKEDLPTVSNNEICAMVAKKAAKIAENVRKYSAPEEDVQATNSMSNETTFSDQRNNVPDASEDLASETALSALIGGNRAKRARIEQVDLIEITSADIVPSKEDFLRRQLQDETGYVPTGHLVGDWTCTSKRKSHITQLASKAQANAQELEAMWAANRQSRRQTQSKYGF